MIRLNGEQINKTASLFGGITDTTLKSCLERIMGVVYGDGESPKTAAAVLGYIFIGGEYNEKFLSDLFELMKGKEFVIITENERIQSSVIDYYGERCTIQHRFETVKKIPSLPKTDYISPLADGFELRCFNEDMYKQSLNEEWSKDFCENFKSCEDFLKNGLGYGIVYGDKLVCGVTSYTYYSGGYEVIVATKPEYRRRGFARAAAREFIMETIRRGKLPSWDAAHSASLRLAESLGYELDYEYIGLKITG